FTFDVLPSDSMSEGEVVRFRQPELGQPDLMIRRGFYGWYLLTPEEADYEDNQGEEDGGLTFEYDGRKVYRTEQAARYALAMTKQNPNSPHNVNNHHPDGSGPACLC